MHHVFFIHASVNGHLPRFHFLAVLTSAVSIGVWLSFQCADLLSFSIYPLEGLLQQFYFQHFSEPP